MASNCYINKCLIKNNCKYNCRFINQKNYNVFIIKYTCILTYN